MRRLLIEEGLPFREIDAASGPEKTAPPLGHPFKMHRWWARRPLAMSRAVVFGSLIADPGDDAERERIFALLRGAMRFKDVATSSSVAPLSALVRQSFPLAPPRVLDCFAGAGSIPLEALRLGCDTTAIDLNPVAHLLERCILEFPQRFGEATAHGRNDLADTVQECAERVRALARGAVQEMYPSTQGWNALVWFWARTMPCRNHRCGVDLPLVTTWWLGRERRKTWLCAERVNGEVQIDVRHGDGSPANPVVRASSVTCPFCGTTASAGDVREWAKRNRFGNRLLAVLEESPTGERRYRNATERDYEGLVKAEDWLSKRDDLPDGTPPVPDEVLDPAQYRKFGMLPYGLRTYRELFTPRQLASGVALCEAVRKLYADLCVEQGSNDRAKAIATYLSLLVGRAMDNNSAFATWENKGEKIRNTFARQTLAMAWDYCEVDPFGSGSGGWDNSVLAVVKAIERCAETGSRPATVKRGNAQDLSGISDRAFDAVIVDPPYYDAIQYADLSDFFYIWMKRSIGALYPDLFALPLTPKAQEVIENRADRASEAYISSAEFERRLARALREMRRVVADDGVVSIVFAHTESDAWERLLRALLAADLVVSSSWPMESEKRGRTTANLSAVLGSSVVLVCRPRMRASAAFYDDVVRELDARIEERLGEFAELGLDGADYLISAIGPAFEVFGKYTAVHRLSGEEVTVGELLALARQTVARHAMRRLLGSEALAAVDDVSLFYLTWRWAYGSVRIPVDEAQKLSKAFNVDATQLGGADGLVETAREAYTLRAPDDRKRIRLGVAPTLIDVLQVACKLFEQGRRAELAELLSASGFAEEPAFWAAARAIAECLEDGDRERTLLVNLLGGQSQTIEAARHATPTEELRLFEVST